MMMAIRAAAARRAARKSGLGDHRVRVSFRSVLPAAARPCVIETYGCGAAAPLRGRVRV